MKNLILFLFVLASVSVFSQAPNIDWMKRFGGNMFNNSGQLIQTQDGGFLIGGYTNSGISGIKTQPLIGYNNDYWIIKLDSLGNIEWQTDIGGGGTWAFTDLVGEYFRGLSQAADGSYYICGNSDSPILGNKTEPSYGGDDYWVVKLTSTGQIIWDKTIGGNLNDDCHSIKATPDGGCIIGGDSSGNISGNKTVNTNGGLDYWVVKLNALGSIEWQKSIGGNSYESLLDIIVTPNNQYLLCGTSSSNISGTKTQNSFGAGDYWIVKLDSNGEVLWDKTIGGNSSETFYSSVKTQNGYALAGTSSSNISGNKTENSKGGTDYWIVAVDEIGNFLWDKTIGTADQDSLFDLTICPDGGYILTGGTASNISGDKTENNYGGNDAWIVRLSSTGTILWNKTIGGSQSDGLNQVIALPDYSFILSGSSFSPVSGNINVSGYGGLDYWLVKLQPETLATTTFFTKTYSVFPNPATNEVNIKFKDIQEKTKITIYNSLGQKIDEINVANSLLITIPLKGESGIYFLSMTDEDGFSVTEKIIKQ